jgi:hypothetical protein
MERLPGRRAPILSLLLAVTSLLVACGGGDEENADDEGPPVGGSPGNGSPGGVDGNSPPSISGKPIGQTLTNNPYLFVPSAADQDGDVLTFSIVNKPAWANFSTSNGRLNGTPTDADLGRYENIVINVSDGQSTTSLGPFEIEVVAFGPLSATLNWTAPQERTDGTVLTDLAGYKVYWGSSPGKYPNSATLQGAGTTTYVVDGLTPGTWYFSASALDSQGLESRLSNPVWKNMN